MATEGNGQAAERPMKGGGTLTKKDFASDQEVRWCPGCGDYAILAAVQNFFPELGIPPHRIAFVTGIGCSGRFVYYMDTYGVHSIHGRAPAIATGLATARPDLSVSVVTGNDGALDLLREKAHGAQRNQIRLRHGEPTVFGDDGERCVVAQPDGSMAIRDTAETPPEKIYVHDAHHDSPSPAFALAHLSTGPT